MKGNPRPTTSEPKSQRIFSGHLEYDNLTKCIHDVPASKPSGPGRFWLQGWKCQLRSFFAYLPITSGAYFGHRSVEALPWKGLNQWNISRQLQLPTAVTASKPSKSISLIADLSLNTHCTWSFIPPHNLTKYKSQWPGFTHTFPASSSLRSNGTGDPDDPEYVP